METTLLNFRVSFLRQRIFVWIALFFLSWSCLPTMSYAQQPTATIRIISEMVLVNGQQQEIGTVLRAGDVIETQAGASVVLELSDGSILEIGENTQVNLAELSQTATNARISRIKLLWGWMRAQLSPGHQQLGAAFQIDTPNAVIGVKFSQPDVEVSYNPSRQETIALAHTMQLMAKNVLTNEEVLVPIGSTVIIVGTIIKVIGGLITIVEASEAGSVDVATTETGMTTDTVDAETVLSDTTAETGLRKGTMVALGAGVVAAGGIAVIVTNADNGSSSNSGEENVFSGVFKLEQVQDQGCDSSSGEYRCTLRTEDIVTLTQSGDTITGNGVGIGIVEGCCTANSTYDVTGTVQGSTATITVGAYDFGCVGTIDCSYNDYQNAFTAPANLLDNGNILRIGDSVDFLDLIRQ